MMEAVGIGDGISARVTGEKRPCITGLVGEASIRVVRKGIARQGSESFIVGCGEAGMPG